MCSGRSRNSISKLISASFGRYGFRLICSLMRQSFEKRLFVCDLWAPRSNAHWLLFISFITYSFLISKCEQFFLSFFGFSENLKTLTTWESHQMSCLDLNFLSKVCTILVWYYIEGADRENESGFVYKRRIARLDWNYKEWYQTKLE